MININWGEAPEGATHAMINEAAIRNYGMWRKVEGHRVYRWAAGAWRERSHDSRFWLQSNEGLYVERPDVVAVAAKGGVKVPSRKPVGWWS